jgi:hypothetical protein
MKTATLDIDSQEVLDDYYQAVESMLAKGGLTQAEAEIARRNLNATQERLWLKVELENRRN